MLEKRFRDNCLKTEKDTQKFLQEQEKKNLKDFEELLVNFCKIFGENYLNDVDREYDKTTSKYCLKIKDIGVRLYNLKNTEEKNKCCIEARATYENSDLDCGISKRALSRVIYSPECLGSFVSTYKNVCKKLINIKEQNNMDSETQEFDAGQLSFYAKLDEKIIRNGDFWLPNELYPSCRNCYPVRISNLGIHYTRKSSDEYTDITVRSKDGEKVYYSDWEKELIYTKDVKVFLENPEVIIHSKK